MKKHPVEEKAVKLLKDGLSDQDVAERVETTPNHVWAVRASSGIRPVTEKQLAIAKAIVARKRREAATPVEKKAATPRPAKLRARRTSK